MGFLYLGFTLENWDRHRGGVRVAQQVKTAKKGLKMALNWLARIGGKFLGVGWLFKQYDRRKKCGLYARIV